MTKFCPFIKSHVGDIDFKQPCQGTRCLAFSTWQPGSKAWYNCSAMSGREIKLEDIIESERAGLIEREKTTAEVYEEEEKHEKKWWQIWKVE